VGVVKETFSRNGGFVEHLVTSTKLATARKVEGNTGRRCEADMNKTLRLRFGKSRPHKMNEKSVISNIAGKIIGVRNSGGDVSVQSHEEVQILGVGSHSIVELLFNSVKAIRFSYQMSTTSRMEV
jgi:hypothetical protein